MKRTIRNSVKDAFDNLPSGICFFDKNGVLALCNRKMYSLILEFTGKDPQSLAELRELMENSSAVVQKETRVYLAEDGTAWRFAMEQVTTHDGGAYTQVTASDVTELYRKTKTLEQGNIALAEYGRRLRRLSADILAVTREEEILKMKMRIHDDIGRSVIATRMFLQGSRPIDELDLSVWKNAVRLLKHEAEEPDETNALKSLESAGCGIGIKLHTVGALPENRAADILTSAIRECMTNAVRHAGAKELYVRLENNSETATATITNSGAVPEGEIVPGGGLSSLRFRVESYGGTMQIEASPQFKLTVSVPLNREEIS